jgi:hypothetical protein
LQAYVALRHYGKEEKEGHVLLSYWLVHKPCDNNPELRLLQIYVFQMKSTFNSYNNDPHCEADIKCKLFTRQENGMDSQNK